MHNVLLMLHPIMPYITEEIFENLFKSPELAISSTWPKLMFEKNSLNNGIDLSIKLISEIRSLRVEKNIPLSSKPNLILKNVNPKKRQIIDENKQLIINLAKLNELSFTSNEDISIDNFIISTVDEITLMIPLDGLVDIEGERNRLNKDLSNIINEIEITNQRLNNPMFINKAPSKVVEEVKEKHSIFNQKKSEIEKALLNL